MSNFSTFCLILTYCICLEPIAESVFEKLFQLPGLEVKFRWTPYNGPHTQYRGGVFELGGVESNQVFPTTCPAAPAGEELTPLDSSAP